ncbi:MAG: 50S ribosomal protein L25 [Anaerolineales bacterium]|uniref:Large ribosomal subunit protein bL25 n=1 Tax=Candidatus Desulfolinea nitratireducens TaxID=2841698 RepID=A0A8J6THQ1_9CHLR|nr:50S ribosomal protein L25 [Candidatus Desulfolinea nitratireducens]
MDKIIVEAIKREVTGKKVKALRRQGKLPAVLYGYGIDSIPVELEHKATGRILAKAESSSLIMVALDGKEYPTLVREKQWDYIRRSLLHVDFQVVSMTEKITSQVRIEFVGEAGAVKDFAAVLITGLTEVEIEALPADLPESIEVDLNVLENIGDGIFVRDIILSDELSMITEADAMVAVANAPSVEKVEKVVDELLEGEDGEEGEEGEETEE